MTEQQPFLLTPERLLDFYMQGIFPMADSRDRPDIFLVDPEMRGIIPLDGLHISKSLGKFLRKEIFQITFDQCFEQVMLECARQTQDRNETWINDGIIALYCELFRQGHTHSVEIWNNDSQLVGGLYGVSIGAAFFGESMFSRETNASKVALVKLVERLNAGGYELLDTQFITSHLETMGAVEITRADYHKRLELALQSQAYFYPKDNQ